MKKHSFNKDNIMPPEISCEFSRELMPFGYSKPHKDRFKVKVKENIGEQAEKEQ